MAALVSVEARLTAAGLVIDVNVSIRDPPQEFEFVDVGLIRDQPSRDSEEADPLATPDARIGGLDELLGLLPRQRLVM